MLLSKLFLVISKGIRFASELDSKLLNFRLKLNTGQEKIKRASEGTHGC
jgi:hypothetical protein